MREVFRGSKWLLDSERRLLGISAGADAAAEHEWGIEKIRRQFKMDDGKNGYERRLVREVPDTLLLVEGGDSLGLFLCSPYSKDLPKFYMERWAKREGDLRCGWDSATFGFVVRSPEGKERLRRLHEAFLARDIVTASGEGLTFKIFSLIPEEERADVLSRDLDRTRLEKVARETGIEEELRKAGKEWFALSPRWDNPEKTRVSFWLNPVRQDLYNYGSFSVEDLRLWARDSGPVMMKKRAPRRNR